MIDGKTFVKHPPALRLPGGVIVEWRAANEFHPWGVVGTVTLEDDREEFEFELGESVSADEGVRRAYDALVPALRALRRRLLIVV